MRSMRRPPLHVVLDISGFIPRTAPQSTGNHGQVLGNRHLNIVAWALHAEHASASALHQRGVVGAHETGAIGNLERVAKSPDRKDLRRLHRPKLAARRGVDDAPIGLNALERIDSGLSTPSISELAMRARAALSMVWGLMSGRAPSCTAT